MNPIPVSFLPVLCRYGSVGAVLAGLLLGQAAGAAEPVTKATPAAPAPLRLSNPEERALLIERINEVIERTNQKYSSSRRSQRSSSKSKRKPEPPTIPTLAVELGRPAPSPSSKTARQRPNKKAAAAAALAATATTAAAATSAAAAVPTILPSHTAAPVVSSTSPVPVVTVAPTAESSASRRYLAERAAELASAAPAMQDDSVASLALEQPELLPWSYAGATGPQAWGQLHPSFIRCGTGQRQSPIEWSPGSEKTGPTAHLPLGNQVFTGVLEHTGRFLQLQVQGLSTLNLRGMEWELQRIQLHYPAEERLGPTEGVVMGVDLFYRAPTSQWAVVSVPLQLGAANPFLAQLWAYLPLHAGERIPLTPGQLQLHDLLPAQRQYYQYLGSFTQPPCTEGVLRLVLKHPGSVAPEQLQRLMALLPPHARPPQPLYGRQVSVGP